MSETPEFGKRQILKYTLVSGLLWGIGFAAFAAGPSFRTAGWNVAPTQRNYTRMLGMGLGGAVGGLIFGVGIGVVISRARSLRDMASTAEWLEPGEVVLRDGPANHWRGLINYGGWLFLTGRRVVFRPHKMLQRVEPVEWNLCEIAATDTDNVFGVVPTGISLQLEGGKRERLVVGLKDRADWLVDIDDARAACEKPA